jgi:starch phosphorylase
MIKRKPARRGFGSSRSALLPDTLYAEHLALDHVVSPEMASPRDRFEAVARALRDVTTPRWLATEQLYERHHAKRAYYLSMEYLLGRALSTCVINLQISEFWGAFCQRHSIDPIEILDQEPDPGLGNGGLGRLAACMLDAMATLGIPGMGYGLRYREGIFRQILKGGAQIEQPDHWLARPDPWEVVRPEERVEVKLGCSFEVHGGKWRAVPGTPLVLWGMPYDRPVVAYGGQVINTLRLWAATAPDAFDFQRFSDGDFVGAQIDPLTADTVTMVLYPDDRSAAGRELRFVQEYFLVACSLADVTRRLRRAGHAWTELPRLAAIQLNDTHPALAVPELMRLLLDEAGLAWEEAWELSCRTLAYTNHTLLPEALEQWPIELFELLLPRQLEIVYEINHRFLESVRKSHPGDDGLVQRVSLIDEGPTRHVRMAHLAVVGSHSVNGVAEIHSELLQTRLMPELAGLFPGRFRSVTNGVSHRRFLLTANPGLADAITSAIGDGWITDSAQLGQLRGLADDAGFQEDVAMARAAAKRRLVDWLRRTTGCSLDPETIFDSQIKRIHEYKRQLLNALHIVILYQRLLANPGLDVPRRTFIFAGKAAPGYARAKLIMHFLNRLGQTVAAERSIAEKLHVAFIADYRVAVAEQVIPATDISEQISLAGFEASGTSNMKFMMNGALTVGTRDGATIEMARAAGEENLFLFGLTAAEVEQCRPWYNPRWHYQTEPETRAALDLIASGHFSPEQPRLFAPLVDAILGDGDYYMHLADLRSYSEAHERAIRLYADPSAWMRASILNIASSGLFSIDRTVTDYASRIWGVTPCRPE